MSSLESFNPLKLFTPNIGVCANFSVRTVRCVDDEIAQYISVENKLPLYQFSLFCRFGYHVPVRPLLIGTFQWQVFTLCSNQDTGTNVLLFCLDCCIIYTVTRTVLIKGFICWLRPAFMITVPATLTVEIVFKWDHHN